MIDNDKYTHTYKDTNIEMIENWTIVDLNEVLFYSYTRIHTIYLENRTTSGINSYCLV